MFGLCRIALPDATLGSNAYRCDDYQGNEGGDDNGQHLLRLDLHLRPGIVVELGIVLQLLDVVVAGAREVGLRGVVASLDEMSQHLAVDSRHDDGGVSFRVVVYVDK